MEGSEQQWQDAYLRQSHDAVVGRLFKGLIHNMNGVVQAFAMQSELFGMMFEQAEAMLTEILAGLPDGESCQQVEQLRDLLYRRSQGVTLMEEKIHQGQEIMGRTLELVDYSPTSGTRPYTINSVVRTEMEFLNADRFFKHTLKKELHFADELPPLTCNQAEVHCAVLALLENALDALRGQEDACLTITTSRIGSGVFLTVEDNGPGVDSQVALHLFEPFQTTKNDRQGLGLFLARKLLAGCGAEITCEESWPGYTRFALLSPHEESVSG